MTDKQAPSDSGFGVELGDALIEKTMKNLFLLNSLSLCYAIYSSASIKMMNDFVRTAPRNKTEGEVYAGETFTNDEKDKDAVSRPPFIEGMTTPSERLFDVGFNYMLRQEPVGEIVIGASFLNAFQQLKKQMNESIDEFKKSLTEEEINALDNMSELESVKYLSPHVHDVKVHWECSHFFFNTLLQLNDDARHILDLLLATFLYDLLNDKEIYPPSDTPMTLRARYAIEIDEGLADKICTAG